MIEDMDNSLTGDGVSLLRAVIDAVPAFMFVVDDDVVIYEFNAAAARLLQRERGDALARRAGDVLHCLHSTDSPDGCGRGPFCRSCEIRSAVKKAFAGQVTVRRRLKLELRGADGVEEIHGLVTVTPFRHDGRALALIVVEDISQLTALQQIVPICAKCKKVRDDDEYWTGVESFFKKTWDIDFSHGYCPGCAEQEMAELRSLSR